MRRSGVSLLTLAGLAAAMAWSVVPDRAALPDRARAARAGHHPDFGKVPLRFEANRGQVDPAVDFVARGPGYTVFLADAGAVVSLKRGGRHSALRLKLRGARTRAEAEPRDRVHTISNYFIGNDPAQWRTAVPNYGTVQYSAVYPGIDLVFYGNGRELEYDFVVSPGANPSPIGFEMDGADALRISDEGELHASIGGDVVILRKPMAYQMADTAVVAARTTVEARYVIEEGSRVRFALGGYDRTRPLTIDPVLSYSTYLGGTGSDGGYDVAVDAAGNAYVTGFTLSTTFPATTGSFDPSWNGGSQVSTLEGDGFVAKLNASGTSFAYVTYLGGSQGDAGHAIAVDASGNAYVTGATSSTNFPTTAGAHRRNWGNYPFLSNGDGWVAKLNAAGSALVYSTFIGGTSLTIPRDLALDSSGNVYVTGETWSNFYTTPTATVSTVGSPDVFVANLSAAGSSMTYGRLLGGSSFDEGHGIAIDAAGNAYVTGYTSSSNFPTVFPIQTGHGGFGDLFVAKLGPSGSSIYATYLGGNDVEGPAGIAIDGAGNAYVTGLTFSTNFPTTAGALQTAARGNGDLIVAKINAAGTALAYSTYLGSTGAEIVNPPAHAIAVDSAGNAYVTGGTCSTAFPVVNALQPTFAGSRGAAVCVGDAILSQLNASGTALLYSSYLGGSDGEDARAIALDGAGSAYLTGFTHSSNFPTASPANAARAGGSDVFVTKIGLGPAPTMTLDRSTLRFGAVSNGFDFTAKTGRQTVRLGQSGAGTMTWTASSSVPWLTVSPPSGTGPATLDIAVYFVTGLTATQTGTITLTSAGAANSVAISVTLSVVSSTAVFPPFGSFDTPVAGSTVQGSVALTGWALDNVGIKRVELWRDLQPGETTPPFRSTPSDPRAGKVFIGNPLFIDGARPDVETLNPATPASHRAGWGYLLLTFGLWNQGNGTYTLYAYAFDEEDQFATLGQKAVIVNNAQSVKPFGTIDSPGIGATVSGTTTVNGWALTPNVNGAPACKIQANGIQLSIDSGPLQPVTFGSARPDIASFFPGYSNTSAAGGTSTIDTSALSDGIHTVGWLVTDDCNRADGVGSRFFNVTTGGSSVVAAPVGFRLKAEATRIERASALTETFLPDHVVSAFRRNEGSAAVLLARGYGELPALVEPDASGSRTIEVKQGERIELRFPRGFDDARQLGPAGDARALPVGSTWDAASGIFYWQPAPGFFGPFRLVFSNGIERVAVRVVVTPSGD